MKVAFSFEGGAMALFILPAEMHVGSGGFVAVLPRNMARKAINEVLGQLKLPLIS